METVTMGQLWTLKHSACRSSTNSWALDIMPKLMATREE